MTIPFGVVGSVHVTCSEVEELAVTLGGATLLGAVKEGIEIIIQTAFCMTTPSHLLLLLFLCSTHLQFHLVLYVTQHGIRTM